MADIRSYYQFKYKKQENLCVITKLKGLYKIYSHLKKHPSLGEKSQVDAKTVNPYLGTLVTESQKLVAGSGFFVPLKT